MTFVGSRRTGLQTDSTPRTPSLWNLKRICSRCSKPITPVIVFVAIIFIMFFTMVFAESGYGPLVMHQQCALIEKEVERQLQIRLSK